MDSADLIIVGSGPAGVAAALGARGRRVLMLDVGLTPPALGSDSFEEKIGAGFESLYNLSHPHISLKLKAPGLSYIAAEWRELTPIASSSFGGVLSLAKGGLANGWGAGVYRFTDRDLRGFPVTLAELLPFYQEIERHVGVCGANDDLVPHFGHDDALLPPLRLTQFFTRFLESARRRRTELAEFGIVIGRSRLAVLTEPRPGRAAYAYENREFFRPCDPALYNPVYTVDELIHAGAIDYRSNLLVTAYRESESCVEVVCRNLLTNAEERFSARNVALAAGAINTARIVLQSNHDFTTRLPIFDNPMAVVPFFDLGMIGAAAPQQDTSLAQLNLVMDDARWAEPVQASLYGASGPLRTDVLFGLPFSARANMALTKYLAPAMGAAMLFYPGPDSMGNHLRLCASGALEVNFNAVPPHPAERKILHALRHLGYAASAALIQRPAMGAGLHFAGPLPMSNSPNRYETDRHGLLAGTRTIYIVDGACFPSLPAKNLTLTIMANALRIGRHIAGLP